jgi:exodeoxyribonuclease-3
MKLATWNVNSLRARLPRVRDWLDEAKPDVLCLQETKARDDECPCEPFTERGYQVAVFGEKGRNGVLIASRSPLEDVRRGLPGATEEDDKRFLSAKTGGLRVISVYAPNGQRVGSEEYLKKLEWFYKLALALKQGYDPKEPLAIVGDWNVAPDDRDVHDPAIWEGGIHTSPPERAGLRSVMGFGLEDAQRRLSQERGPWTWWDYSPQTFKKDRGLRIDLILLTASLASRLVSVEVDRAERADDRKDAKPSDHAPVVATFAD